MPQSEPGKISRSAGAYGGPAVKKAAQKFGGQAEVRVKENYAGILLDPESAPVQLAAAAAVKLAWNRN